MLIRPAEPADAMAVARVHVRSWQVAYRGLMPEELLDGLLPEDRAPRYSFGISDPARPYTVVAVARGEICGFATTSPARDSEMKDWGELCALYVDPDSWGKGVGSALIKHARERLHGEGFQRALLWMLTGNVRAERFYLGDGWSADGAQRAESIWGVSVNEIRYRRDLGDRVSGAWHKKHEPARQ